MKKQKDRSKLTGTIQTTHNGVGFVTTEQFEEDIKIEHQHLNTALNGDLVEIRLHPQVHGKQREAEVRKIIKRPKSRFVGVLEREKGNWFLVPDDRRMYTDILVKKPGKVEHGQKALIKLERWDNPDEDPVGTIVKVIGQRGDHEVEIQSIVLEKGIDTEFPDKVAAEAKKIHKNWKENRDHVFTDALSRDNRRDIRGVTTFTIDPADAKDFDDALSIQKLDDGNIEIGIHIADVSHYVEPGSALDEEAQQRGFSVYLVDRTIPMLPVELSNDICSLNPNEDRLSFSAIFTLDASGTVKDKWFGKTIMHSDKRFSYEEAQEILDGKKNSEFAEPLKTLNTLAGKLRDNRFAHGAIDFETSEFKFELDENGSPIKILRKERLATHKLIEEFMLLANREVALFIFDAHDEQDIEGAFLYRVHESPDSEKIQELGMLLSELGLKLDTNKKVTPKDLNQLFREITGTPIENLVKTAAIKSMQKAVYATKNIGHFGLGFGFYTHFTSPIRRYADLIVHRLMMDHLRGNETSHERITEYRALAQDITMKEIAITEAERESIKYKQVEYMQNKISEVFTGVITSVTKWGIFVEEETTGANGMIHVSSLSGDFYGYEPAHHRLVGQKTKKKFTLGDEVRVKVVAANVDKRTLDFEIVQA